MIHLFHKWSKWETLRKEVIELHNGMLLPYWVQQRTCEKCGLFEIKVSNCKINWKLYG